jgi:hypothetical protein
MTGTQILAVELDQIESTEDRCGVQNGYLLPKTERFTLSPPTHPQRGVPPQQPKPQPVVI